MMDTILKKSHFVGELHMELTMSTITIQYFNSDHNIKFFRKYLVVALDDNNSLSVKEHTVESITGR